MLGGEIIQFGRAQPLGGGVWRLSGLLRGRGGTEPAVTGHVVDEPFVLLDDSLVALDPGATEPADHTTIAALGSADADPVTSPILLAGVTRRPLAPVHGRAVVTAAGGLALSWTRRARGAWQWPDRIDTPLNEQAERYAIVGLGDGAIVARWETVQPQLVLDSAAFAELFASHPAVSFVVRQLGDADVSPPLTVYLR